VPATQQTHAAAADARPQAQAQAPSKKTGDTVANQPPADPSAERVVLQAAARLQRVAAVPPAARPAAPAPAVMATRAAAPAAALALSSGVAAASVHSSLPALQAGDELRWLTEGKQTLPDAAWLQQLAALTHAHGPLAAPVQVQSTDKEQASGMAETRNAADAADTADSANASAVGLSLSWQRGGAPLGTLRLETGAVWWCAAGRSCLRARVPQAALSDLVGKLPSGR
jgi:hypothetical protein